MHQKHIILALALWAAIAGLAIGGETGIDVPTGTKKDSSAVITLSEARTQALALSASLKKALISVESSSLAEKSLLFDLLPQLSASAGASLDYSVGSGTAFADAFSSKAGFSVNQLIYDGGKTSLLATIEAISNKIGREEARAAYFAALEETDSSYYSVMADEAAVEAAKVDFEAANLRLNLSRIRLETGTTTRADNLKVEAEVAAKGITLVQAKRSLAIASAKFSSLTGFSLPLSLAGIDDASCDALAQKLAALDEAKGESLATKIKELIIRGNPDAAITALSRDKATSAVFLAAKDGLPKVSASFSHSLHYGIARGLQIGSGSVSVSISIPIEPWAVKNSVKTAELASESMDIDGIEALRGLGLEAESLVYETINSARTLLASSKSLEYATSHYESILEAYKLSTATSSDLSDAEALASSARSQHIAARKGLLTGISSLRCLAGLETDEALYALFP